MTPPIPVAVGPCIPGKKSSVAASAFATNVPCVPGTSVVLFNPRKVNPVEFVSVQLTALEIAGTEIVNVSV